MRKASLKALATSRSWVCPATCIGSAASGNNQRHDPLSHLRAQSDTLPILPAVDPTDAIGFRIGKSTLWLDTTRLADVTRQLPTTESPFRRPDSVLVYCYQVGTDSTVAQVAGRPDSSVAILTVGVMRAAEKRLPLRCPLLPAGTVVSNTLGLHLGMTRKQVAARLGEGHSYGGLRSLVTYFLRDTDGPGSRPDKVVDVHARFAGDVLVWFTIWRKDERALADTTVCC